MFQLFFLNDHIHFVSVIDLGYRYKESFRQTWTQKIYGINTMFCFINFIFYL